MTPALPVLSSFCRRYGAASALLLALVLAGCGGPKVARPPGPPQATPLTAPPEAPTPSELPPLETPQPVNPQLGGPGVAGVLLPLSGPNAALGQGMLDAAQMALFDVPDAHLTLLPRDTRGTPDGAAAAARDLLDQGVRILIGPLTAGEVSAVKPIAQERGVPVLAFSTAANLAGDGTYLMGFLPGEEVRRVVTFAHDKGAQRFAVLAPATPYGKVITDALRDVAQQQKLTVVQSVSFDPNAVDPSPAVRSLARYDARKAALDAQRQQLQLARDPASQEALKRLSDQQLAGDVPFDAVLLPIGGQQLKTIAPMLPSYGLDRTRVHYLGTGLWDDPSLLAEPDLDGAWYAAPDPAGRADFEKRFQALYGHPPPRLSTLSYDATALAAALTRGDQGANFTVEALDNENGFLGLDGIFRLRPDGRVERGLAVIEIHKSGAVIVGPAPQSFGAGF